VLLESKKCGTSHSRREAANENKHLKEKNMDI